MEKENYYLHCGSGEDYKISNTAKEFLNQLNKTFELTIDADKEEEDSLYTHLKVILNNNYVLRVIDNLNNNKGTLIFDSCSSLSLEKEYFNKLKEEYIGKEISEIKDGKIDKYDLFVQSKIEKNGFIIESSVLSEDEEHDIDITYHVIDTFPKYLKLNFPYMNFRNII